MSTYDSTSRGPEPTPDAPGTDAGYPLTPPPSDPPAAGAPWRPAPARGPDQWPESREHAAPAGSYTPPAGAGYAPPAGETAGSYAPPAGAGYAPPAGETAGSYAPPAGAGPAGPAGFGHQGPPTGPGPYGSPQDPRGAHPAGGGHPGGEAAAWGGGGWAYPPGAWATAQPAPPAPTNGRHRRRAGLAAATAGVVAVAGIGVVVGHIAWGTTPVTRAAAGSTGSGSAGTGSSGTGSGSSGSGGSPFGASPFGGSSGFGSGSTGTGTSGSGSTSSSSGAPANATAIATSVDPGLVDIDTSLGYQDAAAAGTGMVLTSTGEILTNNHVIDGATSIKVTDLGNGRTYSATVVGYDRTQDIAVLQLTGASNLRTVSIGDSSSVKTGESVVGIGNAGGTGGTPSVAGGSITSLDRTITASDESTGNSEQLQGLIETNADIQPGDSGGPLVDTAGHVVGIDTAASSGSVTTSATSPQGYAIPINQAVSIARQIVAGRSSSVIHIGPTAFLGVEVESASAAAGGYGGYGTSGGSGTSTSGAVIAGVASGSPAASSGLGQGDTITSVDGMAVSSPASLTQDLSTDHPGSTVQLVYTDSSGQQHTASVTLASGPPQ